MKYSKVRQILVIIFSSLLMLIGRCGSVAERSKALVLGTSPFGGVGSNPTAASNFILSKIPEFIMYLIQFLSDHNHQFLGLFLVTIHQSVFL